MEFSISSFTVVLLLSTPFIIFNSNEVIIKAPLNANTLEGISKIPWGIIPNSIIMKFNSLNITPICDALTNVIIREGSENTNPPSIHPKSIEKLYKNKIIKPSKL